MKRLFIIVSSLPFILASQSTSRADEWIILGPRAMGMGGAGVASIGGGYGMYWNPAVLGFSSTTSNEETLPVDMAVVGAGTLAAVGDVLPTISTIESTIDRLKFNTIDGKFGSGTQFTEPEIQDTLVLLTEQIPKLNDPGNGAVMSAGVGFGMQTWRIGISAFGLGYAGARPIVDLNNLISLGNQGIDNVIGDEASLPGRSISPTSQTFADTLVGNGLVGPNQAQELLYQAEQAGIDTSKSSFQDSLTNILDATQVNDGGNLSESYTNNKSGARVRGIMMAEVGLGYGHPIGDWLSIGASVRLIHATTYYKPFELDDLEDADDVIRDLTDKENTETSVNFALDAGILIRPVEWIAFGATAKYINQPEFDVSGAEDYEIDPQVRVGVAISPFDWVTIAADFDAYVNHSEALPGYDSQFLGGGVEFRIIDSLLLRAGVSKNLEDHDEDIILHAGLGFKLGYFSIEAAGMVTPTETNLNTSSNLQEIPERTGFSLMVGFNIPL